MNTLNSICNDRQYIQTIHDPVQSHALYGTPYDKKEIEDVNQRLKNIGASRFRVIKNDYQMAIICFKYKETK